MKLNKILLLNFIAINVFLLPHTENTTYAMQKPRTSNLNIYLSQASDIITSSDSLEWRYQYINGVLYKRLYNCASEKWVGKWIRC